jgi:hypothetical protein
VDDPFKNRPEDFLNKGLKATIGALPIVGSTAAEFFNFVVSDPAQDRRDQFLRETFERVEKLAGEFDSLRPDALRENQQFQATVVQAVRISSATASDEKKKLLQNAILNSAIGSVDEFYRQTFLRILEDVSPPHIVLLRYLDNPKAYPDAVAKAKSTMSGPRMNLIEAALPDLTKNRDLFNRVSSDLSRLGLADTSSHMVMMTGGEGMLTAQTSAVGRSFLKFVSDPA